MQRLLIFSLLILIACSCKNERSLIGNWKTIKVSLHDNTANSTFTIYDKNNQDLVKEALIKKYLSLVVIDSAEYKNNAAKLKKKLDKDFVKYEEAKLILETDSTFFMESFGLIIPGNESDWQFGDTLKGKWAQNNYTTLKLEIGDASFNYPFFFRINRLTYDSLNISMTNKDYSNPYIDIEFVRQ